MTAPAQLALVVDPLDDDPAAAVIAAIEARIAHDDDMRDRHAPPAPSCRCPHPWGDVGDQRCCRCGRTVRR